MRLQAAEAAARLRAQLQAQQAAEVRDMTSTFERSLADMERELLLEQVGRDQGLLHVLIAMHSRNRHGATYGI